MHHKNPGVKKRFFKDTIRGIKYKGLHADWWLYTDAEPFKEFEVFHNEN